MGQLFFLINEVNGPLRPLTGLVRAHLVEDSVGRDIFKEKIE